MPFSATALRAACIPSGGTSYADEYPAVTAHGAGEFGHLSGKLGRVSKPGGNQTAEYGPGKRSFCWRIDHGAHLIDCDTLSGISINMLTMETGFTSVQLVINYSSRHVFRHNVQVADAARSCLTSAECFSNSCCNFKPTEATDIWCI